MRRFVSFFASFASLIIFSLPASGDTTDNCAPSIIPMPAKMSVDKGAFRIEENVDVSCSGTGAIEAGKYLATKLRQSTGFSVPVSANVGQKPAAIRLSCTAGVGQEDYKLTVGAHSVSITASNQAGLFNGVQTFLQLLPPEIFSQSVVRDQQWTAPCVRIADSPRFAWRGVLLDVSRHFFTPDELKKYLDAMALQKVNVCHLHLTDWDGWRLEIKKYPRLTEVGAWRDGIGFDLDPKSSTAYRADGKYGGFYTQDEMRDIIKYAQERNITIIPEIEMPGHAGAALAAYPEMRCNNSKDSGVFCIANEESFSFLQSVLSEVFELFPSKYIHIGGDEVPGNEWMACDKCQAKMRELGIKDPHQLENYMIERMGKFIQSKNRVLVGWSEIKEGGGVPPGAVLMDWIGGSVEAASSGHDVVMAPTSNCYFDYYQGSDPKLEPPAMPKTFLPLQTVYSFEPVPSELSEGKAKHIIGVEGCVWTEYIPSMSQVEYMTFPRLCALMEVGWSPKNSRDLNDFMRRLSVHTKRLDAMGVRYRALSNK